MLRPANFWEVEKVFHESHFTFYLTGSYFFGTQNPHSDVDFCTQNYPGLPSFLQSLGFKKISTNYLGDPEITEVYRLSRLCGFVDVQVVKDIDIKLKAQNLLRKSNILQSSQHDWQMAFALLRANHV